MSTFHPGIISGNGSGDEDKSLLQGGLVFALSSSSEGLYFTCRGESLLRRHISVQALHRNFNQVERGSQLGATRSLNSCHSMRVMGMNILWAVRASRRLSASTLNSHDCPIEPPFKVRGHLSVIRLVPITS